jgi:toxin YoeB
MSYGIILLPKAQEGIDKLKKSGNALAIKRLNILLNELREHPKTGIGNPHQLKENLSGQWARSVTNKHRIVYSIIEDKVLVLVFSVFGHYDDK